MRTEASTRRAMAGVVALTVAMSPGFFFISSLGFAFNSQLGVSVVAIGFLAAAVNIGYVAAALPLAMRIDRRGGYWSLTRAPFAYAAAFLVVAVRGGVVTLGIATFAVGALWAGSVAALNRYVFTIAPPGRQGTLMGITQTTVTSITSTGALVLPLVATQFGWRAAILVLAGLGLAGGAVSTAVLQPDHLGIRPAERHERTREPLGRAFWWLVAYGILMGVAMHDITSFTLIYLRDVHGLSSAVAGAGLALMFAGGAIGRAGSGMLLDRGLTVYRLLTFSSVGGAIAIAGVALSPGMGTWALPAVAALGFLVLGHNTAFIVTGLRSTPRARTAFVAASLTVSHVIGGIVGPPIFGLLVGSGSYTGGWLVVVGVLLASLVPLSMLRRGPKVLTVALTELETEG